VTRIFPCLFTIWYRKLYCGHWKWNWLHRPEWAAVPTLTHWLTNSLTLRVSSVLLRFIIPVFLLPFIVPSSFIYFLLYVTFSFVTFLQLSAYFLYFFLSLKQPHLYTFFLLYHKIHFGRGNIRSFKLFPYQVMETQEEEWNVVLPSSLWHSAQLWRQICQIPWYSFLFEAEWTPELLN
jgi:hypothetical protein